jgi:hypothetical protein
MTPDFPDAKFLVFGLGEFLFDIPLWSAPASVRFKNFPRPPALMIKYVD